MKPLDTSPPDPPEFCHPKGHKTTKSQQHRLPLYPGGTLEPVRIQIAGILDHSVEPLEPGIAIEDCTKLLSRGWQLQGSSKDIRGGLPLLCLAQQDLSSWLLLHRSPHHP